jgi:glutathione S-transferase
MSLVLCGFTVSNYYNKVKLALLEKAIPFTEELVYPTGSAGLLAASPAGKVPFIRLAGKTLHESQAIVDYLEDAHPATPLYPADPFERAQCRALIAVMEIYVELVARRLYPAAFFGAPMPPGLKDQAASELKSGIAALKRSMHFAPWINGAQFTLADVAAICHLPLAGTAIKKIYGEDWLADLGGLEEYLGRALQRPHVIAMDQARQAGMEPFVAAMRKKYG